MYIANFLIYKDEDGVYIADSTNTGIVTDGHTFDELIANIKEATSLYFEDEISQKDMKSPFFTLTYSDKINLTHA